MNFGHYLFCHNIDFSPGLGNNKISFEYTKNKELKNMEKEVDQR